MAMGCDALGVRKDDLLGVRREYVLGVGFLSLTTFKVYDIHIYIYIQIIK